MKLRYPKNTFWDGIVFISVIVVSWLLFGFNTGNPDYGVLKILYYYGTMDDFKIKPLYGMLVLISRQCGISYQVFIMLFSAVSLLLLSHYIVRHTTRRALVWLLYMIYPFFLDIVQTTNFFSFVVLLQGLDYLREYNSTNLRKYLIILVIASLIHPSCALYGIFLLSYIPKVTEKKILNIAVFLSVIFVVAAKPLLRLMATMPGITNIYRQLKYYISFNQSYTNGAVLYFLLVLVSIIICRFKNKDLNVTDGRGRNELIIITMVLIFVPFILISSEFVRLIRNMWVVVYCFLSTKCNDRKKEWIFIAFIVALASLLFYKELSINGNYYNSVTRAIIENNLIFGK